MPSSFSGDGVTCESFQVDFVAPVEVRQPHVLQVERLDRRISRRLRQVENHRPLVADDLQFLAAPDDQGRVLIDAHAVFEALRVHDHHTGQTGRK